MDTNKTGEGVNIPHSFAGLSTVLFHFACEMAHRTERDQFTPAVALPIAAILHATASLEAFLNEELERRCSMQPEWKAPIEALDRLEFHNRWLVVPKLLFGRTFDRGAEPFQSFRVLVKLRNELVHYKPTLGPIDAMPPFARDLETRFAFTTAPAPPPGWPPIHLDWLQKILNRECARWACTTAREMVLRWYELSEWPERREIAAWEWSLNFLEGKGRGEPRGLNIKTIDLRDPAVLVNLESISAAMQADETARKAKKETPES